MSIKPPNSKVYQDDISFKIVSRPAIGANAGIGDALGAGWDGPGLGADGGRAAAQPMRGTVVDRTGATAMAAAAIAAERASPARRHLSRTTSAPAPATARVGLGDLCLGRLDRRAGAGAGEPGAERGEPSKPGPCRRRVNRTAMNSAMSAAEKEMAPNQSRPSTPARARPSAAAGRLTLAAILLLIGHGAPRRRWPARCGTSAA